MYSEPAVGLFLSLAEGTKSRQRCSTQLSYAPLLPKVFGAIGFEPITRYSEPAVATAKNHDAKAQRRYAERTFSNVTG